MFELSLPPYLISFSDEPLGARYDPKRQIMEVVKLDRGDVAAALNFIGEKTTAEMLMWSIAYNLSRGLGVSVWGTRAECWRALREGANFSFRPRKLGSKREKDYYLVVVSRKGCAY